MCEYANYLDKLGVATSVEVIGLTRESVCVREESPFGALWGVGRLGVCM